MSVKDEESAEESLTLSVEDSCAEELLVESCEKLTAAEKKKATKRRENLLTEIGKREYAFYISQSSKNIKMGHKNVKFIYDRRSQRAGQSALPLRSVSF